LGKLACNSSVPVFGPPVERVGDAPLEGNSEPSAENQRRSRPAISARVWPSRGIPIRSPGSGPRWDRGERWSTSGCAAVGVTRRAHRNQRIADAAADGRANRAVLEIQLGGLQPRLCSIRRGPRWRRSEFGWRAAVCSTLALFAFNGLFGGAQCGHRGVGDPAASCVGRDQWLQTFRRPAGPSPRFASRRGQASPAPVTARTCLRAKSRSARSVAGCRRACPRRLRTARRSSTYITSPAATSAPGWKSQR